MHVLYPWAGALVVKNPPANAGVKRDMGSRSPRSGRSPGRGHGNPLQYSCLQDRMDREAWWATVHGAAKGRTGRKRLSTHSHAGGFAAGKASLLKATNNQPWQQQYWANADSWMSSLFFPAMGISPCSALSQNVCIENKADYPCDGFIEGELLMQVNKVWGWGKKRPRTRRAEGLRSQCPHVPTATASSCWVPSRGGSHE